MRKSFEKFLARQEALARQYGEAYEEKQHNRGKLTARERIEFLFDEGTFEEVDAYSPSATTSFGKTVRSYGDGVITGFGNINGRQVFAYSQDFNVQGGSLGSVHAAKIIKVQDMALKTGSPVVGLIDSEERAYRKEWPVWPDMPVFSAVMYWPPGSFPKYR